MKKLLLFCILIISSFLGYSQTSNVVSDCYTEWYKMFQKYGTTPVTDGTHDVIVSICENNECQCYLAKISVAEGRLVQGTMMIQQEDGTYKRPERVLHPKYKITPDAGVPTDIFDGMSPAYLSSHDEIVHILFYKNLNKVERKQKKAPMPSELGFK